MKWCKMQHTNKIWHYARTKEAEKIVDGMSRGLMDRLTIYTPRGRGKTTFLNQDLMPLAQKQNFLCIYVDFWSDMSDPINAFAKGVDSALKSYRGALGDLLSESKNKAEFNFGVFKFSTESNPTSSAAMDKLHNIFAELNKLNVNMLFLLDEVQQIGVQKEFLPFAGALRSFMNNRQDNNVFGIFTGSNRDALTQMFSNIDAPFYQSSQEMAFPALDKDFVKYEISVFHTKTKHELDLDEAYDVFINLQKLPKRFIALLQHMVVNDIVDIHAAAKQFDSPMQTGASTAFTQKLQTMKPLDVLLLSLIAKGQNTNLYSSDMMKHISDSLKDGEIKKFDIQNALTRLKKSNDIFSPDKGTFAYVNHEFNEFVSNIILTGPPHTHDKLDIVDTPQVSNTSAMSVSAFQQSALLKLESKINTYVEAYSQNEAASHLAIMALCKTYISYCEDPVIGKAKIIELLLEKPEILAHDDIQSLIGNNTQSPSV